jgi:FecR protein
MSLTDGAQKNSMEGNDEPQVAGTRVTFASRQASHLVDGPAVPGLGKQTLRPCQGAAMKSLYKAVPAVLLVFFLASCISGSAFADTSHARIVRLSLVQGDVRFARDVKGDPLSDSQQGWETAVLNLPIRQGYVVATDNGRAEVEFENGSMAFLAENTVLQFYDLSNEDGGLTTRLILRQGSAEFYVNPERGDYFSVTGGDFSVQAENKTTFRMNNFDDGSNVAVLHGRVTTLANGKNTPLAKGQQLSLQVGEADSGEVARAPDSDEFDQWAGGRISSASSATVAAEQYNSDSGYVSGFGDLYTYGGWFPIAGYGNCWRPYGVGFGWSPFDNGSWYYDSGFGWAFLGGAPWGWLPYHYGGWIFQPGVGWLWSPGGSVGVGRWRPITGTWVRSSTGTMGIVPTHPLDTRGRTPMNLSQGLFEVTSRGVTGQLAAESDAHWKVETKPSRDLLQNQLAEAAAPARVPRTMVASAAGGRSAATVGSTIVYDRTERRFVNSNAVPAEAGSGSTTQRMKVSPESASGNADTRVPAAPERTGNKEVPAAAARQFAPNARAVPTPPSVPRSVTNERAAGQTVWSGGGERGNSAGAARGSSFPSGGSAAAASSGGRGSGGGSSSGGSSGGGGGRPH